MDAQSRPGMIVIFNDANIHEAREIEASDFDKAISEYGSLIRPTQYHTISQKITQTKQLDDHRYCIIEVKDIEQMPHFLKVKDQKRNKDFTFSLWWPNKPKYCYRCGRLHKDNCPELEEFYKALEQRRQEPINKVIYSDSTLRLSDKAGILADVIAMSGGTLGEIGNAIRDAKKHMSNEAESEIIVVAGKNNIKQAQGSSELAKVAYSIDKGIEKIVNQIDDNQKWILWTLYQNPKN